MQRPLTTKLIKYQTTKQTQNPKLTNNTITNKAKHCKTKQTNNTLQNQRKQINKHKLQTQNNKHKSKYIIRKHNQS